MAMTPNTPIEVRPIIVIRLDTWETIKVLTARNNKAQAEVIGELLDKATARYKQKEK